MPQIAFGFEISAIIPQIARRNLIQILEWIIQQLKELKIRINNKDMFEVFNLTAYMQVP